MEQGRKKRKLKKRGKKRKWTKSELREYRKVTMKINRKWDQSETIW